MQEGTADTTDGMGKMRRLIRYFAVAALLTSSAAIAFVMLYNNVSGWNPPACRTVSIKYTETEIKVAKASFFTLFFSQSEMIRWHAGIRPPAPTHGAAVSACLASIAGVASFGRKQVRRRSRLYPLAASPTAFCPRPPREPRGAPPAGAGSSRARSSTSSRSSAAAPCRPRRPPSST